MNSSLETKTWNHELVSDAFFNDTVQVLKETSWNLMLTLAVISWKVDILSRMACWSSGMILAYGASATPGQCPLGFYAFLEVPILQYNKNRKIKPKHKNKIFIKQTVKHTSNLRQDFQSFDLI